MRSWDLLIAGAGPVGLALALRMARAGASVLVLEKNSGTSPRSRAPAIWPRTLEVLDKLDIAEAFLEAGIRHRRLTLADHDRDSVLVDAPLEELRDETDFAELLVLPQSATEALLYERLRTFENAEVRFDHEVRGAIVYPDHVVVEVREEATTERFRGRFLAGCDGARSFVRDAIGAKLVGITFGMQAALADVALDPPPSEARRLSSPRLTSEAGLGVAIEIEVNVWRLILPLVSGAEVEVERAQRRVANRLFGEGKWKSVWRSSFRLHSRVSDRFARDRVVLAGDAAHLNSPVGGQGMNAGIQDSEMLGDALEKALADDDLAPLRDYARRRSGQISEGVNRRTKLMTRLLLGQGGKRIRLVLCAFGFALRVPGLRRRILRNMAMLSREA